jgi:hypothetical protein
MHAGCPSDPLPLGIEFTRAPGDSALARLSWFPRGDDFAWLDDAIAHANESLL